MVACCVCAVCDIVSAWLCYRQGFGTLEQQWTVESFCGLVPSQVDTPSFLGIHISSACWHSNHTEKGCINQVCSLCIFAQIPQQTLNLSSSTVQSPRHNVPHNSNCCQVTKLICKDPCHLRRSTCDFLCNVNTHLVLGQASETFHSIAKGAPSPPPLLSLQHEHGHGQKLHLQGQQSQRMLQCPWSGLGNTPSVPGKSCNKMHALCLPVAILP